MRDASSTTVQGNEVGGWSIAVVEVARELLRRDFCKLAGALELGFVFDGCEPFSRCQRVLFILVTQTLGFAYKPDESRNQDP